MKNSIRVLNLLFLMLLLAMPLQVFAAEGGDPHGAHVEESVDETSNNDNGNEDMSDHTDEEMAGHGNEDMSDHTDEEMAGHGNEDMSDHTDEEMAGHGNEDMSDHTDEEMAEHGDNYGVQENEETGDHGNSEGGHGSQETGDHEYEEPGANVPLLSTFAVINSGFLLFGAIRKLNKKRKSGVN